MRLLTFCALLLITACELQEVTLVESEDVIIAEITLRAGDPVQTALMHRSLKDGASLPVRDARIEITNTRGAVLSFVEAGASDCSINALGTCYTSANSNYAIVPGETYTLRIQTSDGRTLTGVTRVPSDFRITRPAAPVCTLAPGTTFRVEWSSSANAWVYISELVIHGLQPYLTSLGIGLTEDPLRLFGLSISNRDTTVLFPTEFGVFQRFDPDLTKALVAIQHGLPPGVVTEVTIAAADRNYVNWERGGNFNPSGLVRVPSIRGDGTGTFGSIVPKTFTVRVGDGGAPDC